MEIGEVCRRRPGQRDCPRLRQPRLIADHELMRTVESESHASCDPSGDHDRSVIVRGRRLRVRLRASPFSVGTVKMSPRAWKRDTHSGRRERGVTNHGRNALELRTGPRQIARDVDRQPLWAPVLMSNR